jgi:hypothetical protein
MQNNCVTLETAKKLKAAGFPQDTAYGFDYSSDAPAAAPELEGTRSYYLVESFGSAPIAAPTAQEIADQLPHSVKGKGNLEIWSWDGPTGRNWSAAYVDRNNESSMFSPAPTICEALALLWLKLKGGADDAV